MPHEITDAFHQAGLPLHSTLIQMLDNHISHCTDRRGCGFTQSTRFLSALINQPINPTTADDLNMFINWPRRATERLAKQAQATGWHNGWRQLENAPPSLLEKLQNNSLVSKLTALTPTIETIRTTVALPESAIFLRLLHDVVTRTGEKAPEVRGMPVKPDIGSCSQAEEFFLEIAHRRIRRGGAANIIVADDKTPVMVEKMNLGESHSAIVVAPIRIFGVWIPPGGLCALKYSEQPPVRKTKSGQVIYLSEIAEARFLRLTTLAVAPGDRQRAFNAQIDSQLRGQMLSPLTTSIEQLHDFAMEELSSVG